MDLIWGEQEEEREKTSSKSHHIHTHPSRQNSHPVERAEEREGKESSQGSSAGEEDTEQPIKSKVIATNNECKWMF